MTFSSLFRHTFKALRPPRSVIRHQVDLMIPSMPMIEACRADDFDFFRPFIQAGRLTVDQMRHACECYFLGKTKSGQPVFWMVDDLCEPLDAHIGTSWISQLLKQREPLLAFWAPQHCLFGLHLLTEDKNICVVESEAAAVVLSELFPESLWMAYATTPHLTPDLFAPLEGRTVILYPRTDPTMSTWLFFHELANLTRRTYNLDLHVDATLEDYATADQKERCIDLLDFLKDSLDD
jgi:hypothetical protein